MDLNPFDKRRKAVLASLSNLERSAVDLSDGALSDSQVSVKILDSYPIQNVLPLEIREWFTDFSQPPTHVTSVTLGLKYDRNLKFFKPTHSEILLDNNFTIEFLQSRRMEELKQFYIQLVSADKKSVIRPPADADFSTYSLDELDNVLESVGVFLPKHVQTAEWADIEHILQMCKHWESTAETSILLDTMHEQLYIRDTVEGGMLETDDTISFTAEEAYQRTLAICLEELHPTKLLPSNSIQLTLTTNDRLEPPRYSSIDEVPIEFVEESLGPLVVKQFIENPTFVRTEKTSERNAISPSLKLIIRFLTNIDTARKSI